MILHHPPGENPGVFSVPCLQELTGSENFLLSHTCHAPPSPFMLCWHELNGRVGIACPSSLFRDLGGSTPACALLRKSHIVFHVCQICLLVLVSIWCPGQSDKLGL